MTRLRRSVLTVLAAACLLLLAAAGTCPSAMDRPPGEVTEASADVPAEPSLPPIEVTDAVEVADAAAREYCTYRVVTAAGPGCGVFAAGNLVCVDCPDDATCPGAAGGRSAYRYVDADGNLLCSGEWAKRFRVGAPDACLDCPVPPGNPGFEFVGR